jgi:hypothetical protein
MYVGKRGVSQCFHNATQHAVSTTFIGGIRVKEDCLAAPGLDIGDHGFCAVQRTACVQMYTENIHPFIGQCSRYGCAEPTGSA